MADGRRGKLIAAFALLILLALLLQAIKTGGQASSPPDDSSPRVGTSVPIILQEKPTPGIAVEKTFFADKETKASRLEARVTNSNKETVTLFALTSVPQNAAPTGSNAVTVSYENAESIGFVAENPALHEALLNIPAGGQSVVTASVKYEQPAAPLIVLAKASLQQNEERKTAMRGLLKKTASLSLSPAATSALGSLLSKIMLSEEKTLEEKIVLAESAVKAYATLGELGANEAVGTQLFLFASAGGVDESVHQTFAYSALVARLRNLWGNKQVEETAKNAAVAALNDAVNSEDSFFEKFDAGEKVVRGVEEKSGGAATAAISNNAAGGTTQPQPAFDPYALLEELGGSVKIVVTELTPVATARLPLKAKTDLGYPLTKFSGDAAVFLGQQASFEEGGTVLNVKADVSSAEDFATGTLGFDELRGEMTLKFLTLPEREVKIPVEIIVQHINAFEESCGEEYDATSYLEERTRVATPAGQCALDGAAVAREALKYVGTLPYRWGGTSLQTGADCSGFTQAIMRKFGANIPRTAREQFEAGTRVDELLPGDLVFERNTGERRGITHVGIYVGEAVESEYGKNAVIHEPGRGKAATLGSMQNNYWKTHYAGAVRVLASCKRQPPAAPARISPKQTGLQGKTVAVDLAKGTVGGECTQATAGEAQAIGKIGFLLQQKLSESGAGVAFVREENCERGGVQNWRDRAAKASDANVLLEVGFGERAPLVFSKNGKQSQKLGAIMLSQLQAVTAAGARFEATDGSAFYATVPAARVEVFSAASAFDDEEGIAAVAGALADGLQIYFGSEPTKLLACKQGGENIIAAALPKVAACGKHAPLVQLELGKTGLLAKGVSTEFVVAQIMQESSCSGSNPMQVKSCNGGGCSLQENIARGVTQHLLPAYNAGKKAGLSGEKLLRFMGLYYNRGAGTATLAQKLWEQGVPFNDALNQACENNFEKRLCNKPGYGAYYYDKVQERCVALYGKKCETNVI